MPTQFEKAQAFRKLHERAGAFVIPNPWDVGTTRLLERLGFEALATTSLGYAVSQGFRDYELGRDRGSSTAVDRRRNVAAGERHLENCFGDDPTVVAETIRLAADRAGRGSVDFDGNPESPIHDAFLAAERVRAAAETAKKLPFPFVLTARCENYMHQRPDLADTIRRLQSYQEAGADVLYVPGLKTAEEIVTVVRSVNRPVNVLMGLAGINLSVAQLSTIGVKRVSVGIALTRGRRPVLRAAREMRDEGTLRFTDQSVPMGELTHYWTDSEFFESRRRGADADENDRTRLDDRLHAQPPSYHDRVGEHRVGTANGRHRRSECSDCVAAGRFDRGSSADDRELSEHAVQPQNAHRQSPRRLRSRLLGIHRLDPEAQTAKLLAAIHTTRKRPLADDFYAAFVPRSGVHGWRLATNREARRRASPATSSPG